VDERLRADIAALGASVRVERQRQGLSLEALSNAAYP
jgi:hypothetical protein